MNITKNESGLTLVEILAATSILTMVILLFINLSGYTTLANQKDNHEYEALRLAEQTLNAIREEASATMMDATQLDEWLGLHFNKDVGIYSVRATASNEPSAAESSISLATVILTTDPHNGSAKRPANIFVTVNWGK